MILGKPVQQLAQTFVLRRRNFLLLRHAGIIRQSTGSYLSGTLEAFQRIPETEEDHPPLFCVLQGPPVGMIFEDVKEVRIHLPVFVIRRESLLHIGLVQHSQNGLHTVRRVSEIICDTAGVGHVLSQIPLAASIHTDLKHEEIRLLIFERFLREIELGHRPLGIRGERIRRDSLLAIHLWRGIIGKHRT